MVTYTLFKKQTETNGNMIQKCQHQILICVNSEIIKYGKKVVYGKLPQTMLDPGQMMSFAHFEAFKRNPE